MNWFIVRDHGRVGVAHKIKSSFPDDDDDVAVLVW